MEFRRKTKKNKVRKEKCKQLRGTGPQKFRRFFFPADLWYTICVVEFRRRTKSVIKKMQTIKGHRPSKDPPNFFFSRSQDVSCPIIGRNGKKIYKVCKTSSWQIEGLDPNKIEPLTDLSFLGLLLSCFVGSMNLYYSSKDMCLVPFSVAAASIYPVNPN